MAGQSWSKGESWKLRTGPFFPPSPSSAPDHLKSGPRVWARARGSREAARATVNSARAAGCRAGAASWSEFSRQPPAFIPWLPCPPPGGVRLMRDEEILGNA